MICLLILLIISVCIESEEICHFVKPKDTYNGLVIYRYYFNRTGDSQLRMFNRAGAERLFQLEFDLTLDGKKSYEFHIIPESEEKVNETNVVNKFGLYSVIDGSLDFNCLLYKEEANIKCSFVDNSEAEPYWTYDTQLGMGSNSVIVKSSTAKDADQVLVFNRFDKTDVFGYNPFKKSRKECIPNECEFPKFVEQMSEELFQRIDGVVDFDFGIKGVNSGHMILFNMNGKPYICFTIEDNPISSECNTSEKLRPIFENCFQSSETISNSSLPTTVLSSYEPSSDSQIWLIVGIFIAILMIIVIIIVCLISCKKRKSSVKSLSEIKQ